MCGYAVPAEPGSLAGSGAVAELQELLRKRSLIERELRLLRLRLAELREARKVLESGRPRKVFRGVGGLLIEVSVEEALKYVKDEEEVLEVRVSSLERELKEVSAKVAELESRLGLSRRF